MEIIDQLWSCTLLYCCSCSFVYMEQWFNAFIPVIKPLFTCFYRQCVSDTEEEEVPVLTFLDIYHRGSGNSLNEIIDIKKIILRNKMCSTREIQLLKISLKPIAICFCPSSVIFSDDKLLRPIFTACSDEGQ